MSHDEYYYNEHDENQVKKILKTKKKKKVKRRFKFLLLLVILGAIVAFFISDFSKVQSIKITGNDEVANQDILNHISISEDSIFMFVSSSKLEDEVKEVPLVKKASVSKDFVGNVKIEIEEAEKVAYSVIDKKTYVIDELGNVSETKDKKIIDSLQSCPKISEFKDLKLLKEFAKQYILIPELIKNQTSDIIFSPKKVEPDLLKFIMDNGKILYLRISEMAEQLAKFDYEANMIMYKEKCVFRFEGKNIYLDDCE